MSDKKRPWGVVAKWVQRQKNEHFLRRWAQSRGGDTKGKYYIKRHYELNFAFYDLYWYIKSIATRQRVYTHYVRVGEDAIIDKVKEVEQVDLPQIIDKLHNGGEEVEKASTSQEE